MLFKIPPLNKATLIIILCILASINGYFGVLSSEKKIYEIPNLILESLSCKTQSLTNNEKFIVFITDRPMAEKLLSAICSLTTINRQYGLVEVHWSSNEPQISQYVGRGIADLALVKDNVMMAFDLQATSGYQRIAQYQDYSAYLFSLKEKPLLTKQYLWGKRLGLLDYPTSRSGHILPKAILHELGIDEDNMQITYVKSHQALRDLLASGKVDLISTFWQEKDAQRFSANYITPINTKVSGSKWYLKMATQNTDLVCDLQDSLQQLAHEMHSQYYSQLLLSEFNCPLAKPQREAEQNEK